MGYNDEIVAKFGSSTTGFDQGVQRMRQGTASLGDDTNKTFLRASSGAKEFKKLLGELTDQSPILGTALKAAFSPIGAALSGAVLAFGYFKTKIEETNALSDKLEAGTSDPIIKTRDALDAAKKSLAEFDREMEKFNRSQNKSPAEKLTENLHEQLGLLDKQVQAAEKLSKTDRDRLETAKLRVTHGLQGRALQALAGQVGSAQTDVDAAAAASRGLLGKTDIDSATGAIKADDQTIAKLKLQIEAEKKRGGSFFDKAMQYFPTGLSGPHPGSLEASVTSNIADYNQQIKAAEDRQRANRETIAREQLARKNAADNLNEAQSRLKGARGAFDAMSISIESTRQAIVTGGGFGSPAPASSPTQRIADYMSASNAKLHAWNKAHGVPDLFGGSLTPAKQGDQTSKDISDLNAMFRAIIDANGLKVNMTVEDQ